MTPEQKKKTLEQLEQLQLKIPSIKKTVEVLRTQNNENDVQIIILDLKTHNEEIGKLIFLLKNQRSFVKDDYQSFKERLQALEKNIAATVKSIKSLKARVDEIVAAPGNTNEKRSALESTQTDKTTLYANNIAAQEGRVKKDPVSAKTFNDYLFERDEEDCKNKSFTYRVKSFFTHHFFKHRSAEVKKEAARKMSVALKDEGIVTFDNIEIQALKDGRLGKLVEDLRKKNKLPDSYLRKEVEVCKLEAEAHEFVQMRLSK